MLQAVRDLLGALEVAMTSTREQLFALPWAELDAEIRDQVIAFACEVLLTHRERRGAINWALTRGMPIDESL